MRALAALATALFEARVFSRYAIRFEHIALRLLCEQDQFFKVCHVSIFLLRVIFVEIHHDDIQACKRDCCDQKSVCHVHDLSDFGVCVMRALCSARMSRSDYCATIALSVLYASLSTLSAYVTMFAASRVSVSTLKACRALIDDDD